MTEQTKNPSTKPAKLSADDYQKPRTLWGDAWRQFRRHRFAIGAMVILFFIILFVTIGPFFWRVDPEDFNILNAYSGPTAENPFGADNIGRDTLIRTMLGGRISMMIGLTAMALAMTFGTLIGILSGYYKALDAPLMRLTDIFLSLPLLPLLLVITMLFREPLRATFGTNTGIFLLTVVVIGALGWMPTARLVRGEVLTVKGREFVMAARSVGASNGRILRAHILPNVLSPVIVAATFSIASAIITESALSFLGLGFPPDFATWGRLLFDGQAIINVSPSLAFFPGLFISVTVLCVNFIGDGLRDALDPRLRK